MKCTDKFLNTSKTTLTMLHLLDEQPHISKNLHEKVFSMWNHLNSAMILFMHDIYNDSILYNIDKQIEDKGVK